MNARVAAIGILAAPPTELPIVVPVCRRSAHGKSIWMVGRSGGFAVICTRTEIEGPAIVEADTTTVLLLPGDKARVTEMGWLISRSALSASNHRDIAYVMADGFSEKVGRNRVSFAGAACRCKYAQHVSVGTTGTKFLPVRSRCPCACFLGVIRYREVPAASTKHDTSRRCRYRIRQSFAVASLKRAMASA